MRYDIQFFKYQGCGNDFIIKDEMEGAPTPDPVRSKLATILTDRHFKIGADGMIFIEQAPGCDGSMRLFEPAGNEADMCGNGLRCVAAYLAKKLDKDELDILTRDGVKHVVKLGELYKVDMGPVRTTRAALAGYITDRGAASDSLLSLEVKAADIILKGALVNSGEPHLVFRCDEIDALDVRRLGESVNSDRARFPKGVNLNFVQVVGPQSIKIRTYERGVYDETLACGTGATASAAVALNLGWVSSGPVEVIVRGGRLAIEFDERGHALMVGPASYEFEGRISVDL